MEENSSVTERSPVDVFHFALCAAGFFIGVGGVILGSVCVALAGVFFLIWGLLYFVVTS